MFLLHHDFAARQGRVIQRIPWMENAMTMASECCAPGNCKESGGWAMMHFGGAELGDKRRSSRLVMLAAAIAENPQMSLPKQLPDWSDLTGAYRLLSNEAVDPQAILAPHKALVRQAAGEHGVILCVQDTTQLDFTLRTGITGLGIIGDGTGRGLVQHAALAVLPDKRLLGILDLNWHAMEPVPKGEKRKERRARWTERYLWHEAAQRIGPWRQGRQLIHVGDRHADVFRFMHEARTLGHDFIVRAMHDRYVDDATEHLWEKVLRQEPLGQMSVTLGVQRNKANAIKRIGREALLTIRVTAIEVPPPQDDPRTLSVQPLSLWAVHLVEEHPPAGVDPVEWMLVTSLQAMALEEAQRIIGYYTCRWVIEEWHRCLKEGCKIEDSQLDEAADIERLAAVLAVVAARLLEMRDLAQATDERASSPESLRRLVPAMYITMAAGLAKVPVETLTPRLFWRTIAKRGGYLGRKNDPRPGWKVLWRGWTDLVQMVRGAELYQQLLDAGGKCV
jgi:hypothetical protein